MLRSFSLTLIIFFFLSVSAVEKTKKIYNMNSGNEIIKKYTPSRPKEALVWTDEMPNRDRIDLKNDYFNISYPKCFKVEPIIQDSDDINNKTSAAINFFRTNKCNAAGENSFMSISYRSSLESNKVEIFEKKLPAVPQIIYAQRVLINGASSSIEAEIDSSRSPETMFQPILLWRIKILCKGKLMELFELGFVSHTGEDAERYLERKKFEIPEDFKQIISSFQCRKDR